VVYLSEKLLEGQIRGIRQNIKKLFAGLEAFKEKIRLPAGNSHKRSKSALEDKISALAAAHGLDTLLRWNLNEQADHTFDLTFWIDQDQFRSLQDNWLGRRILITNRHNWSTQEIILAYWGQSRVEYAFRTMKNPFHLALRPQYHWTDQKIEVHGFICLLAFLLTMVAYKQAKEQCRFKGSPHSLLEKLAAVRLATFIENPVKKSKGRYKTVHCIEDMDEDIRQLAQGLDLFEKKFKPNKGFSVYN
jgi:transposase